MGGSIPAAAGLPGGANAGATAWANDWFSDWLSGWFSDWAGSWAVDPRLSAVLVGAAVAVGVVGWAAGTGRVWRWRHRRWSRHAQEVLITPPPQVEPGGVLSWWLAAAELLAPSRWRRWLFGTPHLGFEYRWAGRQLQVVVWVPDTVAAGPVAAAARAAWPGASTQIGPASAPIHVAASRPAGSGDASPALSRGDQPCGDRAARPRAAGDRTIEDRAAASGRRGVVPAVGGALRPVLPAWFQLRVDHDTDPLRHLIGAGAGLSNRDAACVQVLARPATPRQVRRLRAGAAALRTGGPGAGGAAGAGLDAGLGVVRGALDLALEVVTDLFTVSVPDRRPASSTRPSGGSWSARAIRDPIRERDARPAIDKLLGPQWEVAIRYAVTTTPPTSRSPSPTPPRAGRVRDADADAGPAPRGGAGRGGQASPRRGGGGTGEGAAGDGTRRRLTAVAHGLASAFGVYSERNRLGRLRLGDPVRVLAGRPLRRGFLLSTPELAVLAGLPLDLAVPGLDRARARVVPAPVAVPGGGRAMKVLGRALVGGHAVALPVADARQHVHLLGSTGSGKSTLMCQMITADVAAGRGVVVIDPKGDLAIDVLDRLPRSVANRLVVIDPDQPGGATLNPLRGGDADLLVDNIVSIFAKIFERHWGPRMDDVLRVACLTLMRHRGANLIQVPPLLNNKQFRARFTVDLDDPEGLRGFWEWYDTSPPALRAQVIGPVLARLRSLLLRDFVRTTLGAPNSSFDMGRVLDGGILIARLPKGQLGEETAKLMSSFVFASVWQAATARARLPEARRRDAAVYVDEAHNVLNLAGSVADMLAEARGYHLSLVLAHQNLTQLPRDAQLALSANARNKIFFACSPEDAKQLARHTIPELDEHDVANLDAFNAATRLVINNRETAAFTLATNPPRPPLGTLDDLRAAITRPPNPDGQNHHDTQDDDPQPHDEQHDEQHDGPAAGAATSATAAPTPQRPRQTGRGRSAQQTAAPSTEQANRHETH